MKTFITAVIFLMAANVLAYGEYSLKNDTENYTTYTDEYDTQYVFVKGLQRDLFQKFEIKDSKGPKWQAAAEAFLESEHDFHEWSSYFGERMEDQCDEYFSDPEDAYEAYNTWELRWRAIKTKSGSKKTVLYIVDFVTLVHGDLGTCELHDAEYVFENKLVNSEEAASKTYLGEFSSRLPRF